MNNIDNNINKLNNNYKKLKILFEFDYIYLFFNIYIKKNLKQFIDL